MEIIHTAYTSDEAAIIKLILDRSDLEYQTNEGRNEFGSAILYFNIDLPKAVATQFEFEKEKFEKFLRPKK